MVINAQTLETVHAYAREHLTGISEIKKVVNPDTPRRFSVGVRIGIAYFPERGTHAYRLVTAQLFGALAAHHVPLTDEIAAIKEALTASYSRALESSLAYGERAAKGTWSRDGKYLGAVLSREESARFGELHVWDWLITEDTGHAYAEIAATIPAPRHTPTTT